MKRFLQPYLTTKWPTILWSVIVFVLLAMPGNGIFVETWFNSIHLDKLIHFFLFFVLVWLWVQYVKQGKSIATAMLLLMAAVATFYGITMEFVQLYVGRDFGIGDMLADSVGAFTAAFMSKGKK
jgi:VanZ like family